MRKPPRNHSFGEVFLVSWPNRCPSEGRLPLMEVHTYRTTFSSCQIRTAQTSNHCLKVFAGVRGSLFQKAPPFPYSCIFIVPQILCITLKQNSLYPMRLYTSGNHNSGLVSGVYSYSDLPRSHLFRPGSQRVHHGLFQFSHSGIPQCSDVTVCVDSGAESARTGVQERAEENISVYSVLLRSCCDDGIHTQD